MYVKKKPRRQKKKKHLTEQELQRLHLKGFFFRRYMDLRNMEAAGMEIKIPGAWKKAEELAQQHPDEEEYRDPGPLSEVMHDRWHRIASDGVIVRA